VLQKSSFPYLIRLLETNPTIWAAERKEQTETPMRRLLGFVLPLICVHLCSSLARSEVLLPSGTKIKEVNFERHVASLLGRMGCNAGSCHGSFQGKGGFYLSLFGYSPEKDFLSIARDGMGRRVNLEQPERSLILLKATAQVPHEGGKRFAKDSWQYQVFRDWIAQGAKSVSGSGTIKAIKVEPAEHRFLKPAETVQLKVIAEFTDGSSEDVTPFCDFRIKNDYIAEASPQGTVRGLRPGDTIAVVSYRGNLLSARVLVPVVPPSHFVFPQVPANNFIDHEVVAKLKQLNIVPSELADDAEFLRRVTIDCIGCLPTPQEVRSFLSDKDPDKRSKKIDALLIDPLHAALLATKFCDITGNNTEVMEGEGDMRAKRSKMWHDWFRQRIADNKPYDEIVHGILCATSRDGKDVQSWIHQEIQLQRASEKSFETDYAKRASLDLFWRRTNGEDFFPLEQMGELASAAFLGVRLECAQCHKHPYDRWTQADYRAFANVFSQTKFGSSPEVNAAVASLLTERRKLPPNKAGPAIPRIREVYVSNQSLRQLPDPVTNGALKPKALGGPEYNLEGDVREKLFQWLVQPENPFFAKSFVNRLWAIYFGVGLVEPVDNFSVANPPSNERLLNALARDFVEHKYDIRHLERSILLSRTYQLSSTPNASNAEDRNNYSHAYVRRLPAEVVVDVLNSALGATEDFGSDVPKGIHAIEIGPNRVQNGHLARLFRIFGRPTRVALCDCERSFEPAVPQTLFLMSDEHLLKKMKEGRLQSLLADRKSNEQIVEELFLATQSRLPDEKEKKSALDHMKDKPDRQAAFVDLLWALINTREFILNH
jgi:hypothetical protein